MTTSLALAAERDAKLRALGPRPPWWRPFARLRWARQHADLMVMDVSQYAEWVRSVYGPAGVVELAARRRDVALAALRKAPRS